MLELHILESLHEFLFASAHSRQLRIEFQELNSGEKMIKVRMLGQIPDLLPHVHSQTLRAEEVKASGVHLGELKQASESGGFSSAVGTDKSCDAPGLHGERSSFERINTMRDKTLLIGFMKILYPNDLAHSLDHKEETEN